MNRNVSKRIPEREYFNAKRMLSDKETLKILGPFLIKRYKYLIDQYDKFGSWPTLEEDISFKVSNS